MKQTHIPWWSFFGFTALFYLLNVPAAHPEADEYRRQIWQIESLRQEIEEEYACPMHPEVRSGKPGKCPKCGMILDRIAKPFINGEYQLKLDCSPPKIIPGKKIHLRLEVLEPQSTNQATRFSVVHEKLLHLFIVSQDLNVFQHLHPVLESDGSFSIETVLPHAGHYMVYADCFPVGGTPQVLRHGLTTSGYRTDLFASGALLTPDDSLIKRVDDLQIELKTDPEQFIAGKVTTLKYHLTDAASGRPVTDLVPYLGAWGHTLILSEDQSDYVHSHPTEMVSAAESIHSGPDVNFEALLPRPGKYRIWSQFQRGARLTTVSFTIQAVQLR